MNKKLQSTFLFWVFVILGLINTSNLKAQTPAYFSATGTANNVFPFQTTTSNKVQWIYVPSEFSPLAPSGVITKVYFKSASAGTNVSFTNLEIKMGYTPLINTVTGPWMTGLTTVFQAATYTIPTVTAGGWVQFTLQTPFVYTTTQNLIVEASETAYVTGFQLGQTSVGGNKRMYANVTSATATANTGLAPFGFDLVLAPNNAGVSALIEPPTSICAGNQDVKVQVNNSGSAILNNVKINWSLDGVPQAQISHTTPIPVGGSAIILLGNVNFPASVNKSIKVWTSLPNGIADTVNGDDTLVASRAALPAASAAITATGPTRFCPGGSVILQAPTGTSYTYQWKLNGNNIASATGATHQATASGVYTASINNSVCAINSNPIIVTVGPPQVNLGNDSAFCETKSPFVLDAHEPNAQYLWSTGDSTKTLALTDQGGTIWVNVTLGPNCVASDTVHLNISPLPKVSGMSYIKENAYTYHFQAAGPRYVDGYHWLFSDNMTDTGQKVTHVFPVGQHHSARLVIFNSCGKDSVELQLPLSVGTASGNAGNISIYPNPASDILTVAADNQSIGEIMIVNNLGAVVYRANFDDKRNQRTVDVSSFAQGQYYIRVNVEGSVVSRPLNIVK